MRKGEIILVRNCKHKEITLKNHPFIVFKETEEDVQAFILEALKKETSAKKLSFRGNVPVWKEEQKVSEKASPKDAVAKTDQIYHFNKASRYPKIGELDKDAMKRVLYRHSRMKKCEDLYNMTQVNQLQKPLVVRS